MTMKILQVTPDYYPEIGGIERHIQAISAQMAARGHTVVVATMAPRVAAPLRELTNEVTVLRFPWVGTAVYRFPRGLLRYLQRSRDDFDIVHVHNYHTSLIPIVALARPRHMVVTPHLNDRPHSMVAQALHHPYRAVGRWALLRAQAIVCVSPPERDRLLTRLCLPADRTQVIATGVDVNRFHPVPRGAAKGDLQLLVVGRLEPYKRIDGVIDALALLPPTYRLMVAGDGPARHALEQHAAACGVGDRVTFTGHVSDDQLVDVYQHARVLINLSTAEAFGLTLIEAVATGCRVVSSDIPAFRNLAAAFPDRIMVVPQRGNHAVAAAIEVMAQRPNEAPVDLADYSWTKTVDSLLDLYGRLVYAAKGDAPPYGAPVPRPMSISTVYTSATPLLPADTGQADGNSGHTMLATRDVSTL